MFPELVVISFLELGGVLLLLAELGFMGVFVGGVRVGTGLSGEETIYPEVPEWGQMLSEDGSVNVLGIWTGYEGGFSRELVIIFTTYGGADDDFQDLGLMLEMIRLLKDQDINPRRSLMFVAWQEGTDGPKGVDAYFKNERNFHYLGLNLIGDNPLPTLALHIEESDEARFWIQNDVQDQLPKLLARIAAKIDAQLQQPAGIEEAPIIERIPWIHVGLPLEGVDNKAYAGEHLQDLGEILVMTLITFARDEDAWEETDYGAEAVEMPVSSTSTPIPTSVTEDEVIPAVAEILWGRPEMGEVFQPGDVLNVSFLLRGAPGAYFEGEAYFEVRVQVTVQRFENDEELDRLWDRLNGGFFSGIILLPYSMEPGEYSINVSLLSETLHGHPLELAGETSRNFTVVSGE